MQNKFYLRIENLLWAVPAVAGYSFAIFLPDNYCNVLLFDNHFLISHLEATFLWIIVLLFPFLLHYTLRHLKKGNEIIKSIHVILSLAIIISFPFLYNSIPLILDEWHNLTVPPPVYDKWQSITYFADILWICFATIQIAFFIYGFSLILKKTEA